MPPSRHRALVVPVCLLAMLLGACQDGPTEGADVSVTLTDFAIDVGPATVPQGTVRLDIDNEGETLHEVEIFTLPEGIDPGDLTISSNVADTDAAGLTLVDELEDIAPATGGTLPVSLEPGRYAILCNLPAHYGLGMYALLTVEGAN